MLSLADASHDTRLVVSRSEPKDPKFLLLVLAARKQWKGNLSDIGATSPRLIFRSVMLIPQSNLMSYDPDPLNYTEPLSHLFTWPLDFFFDLDFSTFFLTYDPDSYYYSNLWYWPLIFLPDPWFILWPVTMIAWLTFWPVTLTAWQTFWPVTLATWLTFWLVTLTARLTF